jgi:RNA polymerase sigma factor (sigma-70 family)
MKTGQRGALLRDLGTLFDEGALGGLSDGQLLERFLAAGEEAAFRALVERHGPTVWGVCRRVVGDHHDAEDAFQATFLVLARKATSIVRRDRVGSWLYGVAYQTALKARTREGRRRVRETPVSEAPEPEAAPPGPAAEWLPLLDEELGRLSEKDRAPIVLCELEGKTHQEAACLLGWPIGTLSSRLSRAKVKLGRRLSRRGVGLPVGARVAMGVGEGASAGMPGPLAAATARAARAVRMGEAVATGLVSARVAALTRGVLGALWLGQVKLAAGAGLVLLLAVLGGLLGHRGVAADKAVGTLRDTILVLDQQFWQAASDHDTETLARLIADDYYGMTDDGSRWTKAAVLEQHRAVRTGDLERTSQREVIRVAEDAAILTYDARFKIFTKEGVLWDTAHQRMISCWARRHGGWFVAFSRATDLERPGRQAGTLGREVPRFEPAPAASPPGAGPKTGGREGEGREDTLMGFRERILEAYGGEEKLRGLNACIQKVRQTEGDQPPTTLLTIVRQPDQYRFEMPSGADGSTMVGILTPGGMRRWRKYPDGRVEELLLSGTEMTYESHLETIRYFGPRRILKLFGPESRPELLGEIRIDDRIARGIRLHGRPNSSSERTLYFDTETGLLLMETSGAVETLYRGYARFDGFPVARKVDRRSKDGTSRSVIEVIEFRAPDGVDEELFRKP